MSRFTRHACVAATALVVFAPAAGAAVYQHSPGVDQSFSVPQSPYVHSPGANPSSYLAALGVGIQTTYAHSPGLNPYRNLEAFDPSPSTPTVTTTTTSSFDWTDAGIGAGVLATLLLLIGATAIVVRKSSARRLAV